MALAALGAAVAASPVPAGRATPRLYWGANVGPQLTGGQAPWDHSAQPSFDRLVGKHAAVVHFGSPFTNCSSSPCSYYAFPTRIMSVIRGGGRIPFLSWSSQALQAPAGNSEFALERIISGRYDPYISSFARDARRWGHPFFLRFDWEMNGNWYPWAEGTNGNSPGQFAAAWRHVHDIFSAAGARNVSWVWCPNADPTRRLTSLDGLYPGDRYVDWTCLDGYNFGNSPSGPGAWQTFDELFAQSYRQIVRTIAPSKPMIVGEVASTEKGGSKARWIADALARLPGAYPQVHGLLWYEGYDNGMDWPLETSRSALGAFSGAIRRRTFAANSYANLSRTPIPPPG